jgi:Tfp pilus assembly protein PilZ
VSIFSGRNRRKFPRVALDARVEFSLTTAEIRCNSRIKDLSENGVFVLSNVTRPLGTGIDLILTVEGTDGAIHARGIIVHEVPAAEATSQRPAGFGVMFVDVDDTSRKRIRDTLRGKMPID